MKNNYPVTLFVITAIVCLVVGFAISQVMVAELLNETNVQLTSMQTQVNDLQSEVQTITAQDAADKAALRDARMDVFTKASVFDTKLHDLLQEHDFLLINTVRRSLNTSNPVYDSSHAALQLNIREIADQIAYVYGNDAASQFEMLWDTKINNFLKYTANINANGQASADAQLASDMASYELSSARFWTSISPFIDNTTITNDVTIHVNDVKTTVDYWNAGDYVNYFSALHKSYLQMGVFADDLAVGMIKHHPEKFQ